MPQPPSARAVSALVVKRRLPKYIQVLGKDGAADADKHDAPRHFCAPSNDMANDATEHYADVTIVAVARPIAAAME